MRVFGLLAAFLLVGCDSLGIGKSPVIGEEVHEHIRNCYQDTVIVPMERSENCLAALRMIDAAYQLAEDCDPEAFFNECDAWEDEGLADANNGYSVAAEQSLWFHGRPSEELLQQYGNGSGYGNWVYRDLRLMEKLFQHCLQLESGIEPASTQRSTHGNFQEVYSVSPPILREGELCFRVRYERGTPKA